MRTANTLPAQTQALPPRSSEPSTESLSHELDIREILKRVQEKIAPVWPLKDYVAVNPYAGISDQKFLTARQSLQAVSDLETLMSVDYYREQFDAGVLTKADIDAAVDELVADRVAGAERITVNQVVALLLEKGDPSPTADSDFAKSRSVGRPIRTLAEQLDRLSKSDWTGAIREEISKHCAAHYDEGQAAWSSPWQELPLYQAWRSAAVHDRSFEILGVAGFRKRVAGLPHDPQAAVVALLGELRVPRGLWEEVLLCQALMMPGWSAWTKYQQRQAACRGDELTDFTGLLAMRLAYEAALSARFGFHLDWSSVADRREAWEDALGQPSDGDLLRYALLKASEIAYRRQLISELAGEPNTLPTADRSASGPAASGPASTDRQLAQMVFCIDVRSERLRRHLEAASAEIETFGFAGFFGLPIEYVPLGESRGSDQVPVLISPQFKVHEHLGAAATSEVESAVEKRSVLRFLRKAWKEFQSSAVSCFGFVETTGLFYGSKLISRSLGLAQKFASRYDGIAAADRKRLGPSLEGLRRQGISTSQQADLAESMLRGIGLVDEFARLVVFCGHGGQTENNPLQAGLDCGACGGHSGEANARLAAKLLNQPSIRQRLAARGIAIADEVHFVAALHNTTTDCLEFFDTDDIPASHREDLEQLTRYTVSASQQTRSERLTVLPGANADDLLRRSRDWSEVRPEWGLAGNAAFIAAPRSLTKSVSLAGRSFLHSYDYRRDPGFKVLEQIMTAPLVVAHWINMQYYASTVDPHHFGSGNKTVHNVVGRFGIYSGNGGDLMTGLPWQSIHDGKEYQHHPLRLLAVIAAPRDAIEAILAKHSMVENLLANGWMQLIAIDEDTYYRYTEQQVWEELQTGCPSLGSQRHSTSLLKT